MQPMLFGTIPNFEDILAKIASLEKMINGHNLHPPGTKTL
jgi:hypothetical protein